MITEYIHTHQPGFWIALGFALMACEVLLFGFSTIIFLFAGIGAVVTGLLMMAGILPETWIAGVACFGISTGIISALLWKPFSKMQRSGRAPKPGQDSDLLGLTFVLSTDISMTEPGSHRYSGIDWRVEPDKNNMAGIPAGTPIKVTGVDVGIFRVCPVNSVG